MPVSTAQLAKHVAAFSRRRPDFTRLAKFLETFLATLAKPVTPLAQIQTRTKTIASFAEKIVRKDKYTDPINQITDLCGARIVTHLKSEAERICQFLRDNFVIDNANSLDTLSRLRPEEFGYRSVHFVVQIRPGKPPGVSIPKRLLGLKAEIQVRTIAQHAWSDIGHDRLYKSGCSIPSVWRREAARIAALLESADESFQRLVEGVEMFHSLLGGCHDTDGMRRELQMLATIRQFDPKNADLATRQANLALALDDWPSTIATIRQFRGRKTSPLLVCLGVALCGRGRMSKSDRDRRGGLDVLRRAVETDRTNVEARLRLAELLSSESPAEALSHYSAAFDLNPSDPATLSGYVRLKIALERTTAFVPLLRPSLDAAVQRCRDLAAAGVERARSLYRIAGFLQLLGSENESESLSTLARAIRFTSAESEIDVVLEAADRFAALEPGRRDVKCAQRLLLVARQTRFSHNETDPRLLALATKGKAPFEAPVVIVAGGCDPFHHRQMAAYRHLLREAFRGFRGAIISGGTREGISGLVGEIARLYQGRVKAVGYLPATLPTDGSATPDKRYDDLRRTDGAGEFSALEPLQNWIDLLASGIQPSEVKVLGINGGAIAGLEYRIALALGAQVALLEHSGRQADRLISELRDDDMPGLIVLPDDAMTVRAFLRLDGCRSAHMLNRQVQSAAQWVHAQFIAANRHKHPDPAMQPWKKLPPDIQQSNVQQIRYAEEILRTAGFGVRKRAGAVRMPTFTRAELDFMAEMEHGRWNFERLRAGWKYGEQRDVQRKLSPSLKPWHELSPDVRKWDCDAIRDWPRMFSKFGLEIHRFPRRETT